MKALNGRYVGHGAATRTLQRHGPVSVWTVLYADDSKPTKQVSTHHSCLLSCDPPHAAAARDARDGASLPHTRTHPAPARALSARERHPPGRHCTPLGATHLPKLQLCAAHAHTATPRAAAPARRGRTCSRDARPHARPRRTTPPHARDTQRQSRDPRGGLAHRTRELARQTIMTSQEASRMQIPRYILRFSNKQDQKPPKPPPKYTHAPTRRR